MNKFGLEGDWPALNNSRFLEMDQSSEILYQHMHILIAPNAFKHSLSASEAAKAIKSGLLSSKLNCTCEWFPIGDGGDGTCELLVSSCNGVDVPVQVQDPLGRTINTSFGWIEEERTAVIEMADASGIRLLSAEELNPMQVSSYGTGQMVKNALDKGAERIIIGMGGSATVDGGAGILQALGVQFLDDAGKAISEIPGGLEKLDRIDLSGLDQRVFDCEITILCDVDNPLLGNNGAATVFGPQKGADPEMVQKLESILERYARVIFEKTGVELSDLRSGGVAGGASAGLHALLRAQLVNGIDYFLGLTRFNESLLESDLVITGEGSIDVQTLQGKGPFGVAKKAKLLNIPVVGLAGKIPLGHQGELYKYFDVLMAIGNEPVSLEESLSATAQNLSRISVQLGNLMSQFI